MPGYAWLSTRPLESSRMSSFAQFLSENKVWWITPIVLVAGLIAYLLIFHGGGTPDESAFVYEAF